MNKIVITTHNNDENKKELKKKRDLGFLQSNSLPQTVEKLSYSLATVNTVNTIEFNTKE